MKMLLKALLLSASGLVASAAMAQETLVFATTNPEQHPINSGFLIPWAERVNEASNGAVTIELRHGPMIANHTNFYDRVVDDVVQLTWGLTAFNPGRFPRSLVATLPFIVDNAEQGTVAMCRLHERGAFDEEMEDIVPLLWVEFPQASLHLNGHEARGLEDISGRRWWRPRRRRQPSSRPMVARHCRSTSPRI